MGICIFTGMVPEPKSTCNALGPLGVLALGFSTKAFRVQGVGAGFSEHGKLKGRLLAMLRTESRVDFFKAYNNNLFLENRW